VKTCVNIPDEVFNEVKALSGNFSSLVTEALRDYIRKAKVQKALSSFGKWEHRKETSVDLVNRMREEDKKRHAHGHR
jgi:hypothetical protein